MSEEGVIEYNDTERKDVYPTGQILTWGDNKFGQLGLLETDMKNYQTTPSLVQIESQFLNGELEGDDLWMNFAQGLYHMVMIRSPGTLWSCGSADFGQTGRGTIILNRTPQMIGDKDNWQYVSCGTYYTIALDNEGNLYGFGKNDFGQLGFGNKINSSVPKSIKGISDVKYVSCGSQHSFAITKSGELYAWGDNRYGQLGLGHQKPILSPTLVSSDKWRNVSAGMFSSAGVKEDGSLYIWGFNEYGLFENTKSSLEPILCSDYLKFKSVSCGAYHTTAISEEDKLYVCGYNGHGELGLGNTDNVTSFTALDDYINTESGEIVRWLQVTSMGYHNFGIQYIGNLYGINYSGTEFKLNYFGDNTYKLLENGEKYITTPTEVSTSSGKTVGVSNDSHGGVFGAVFVATSYIGEL